MNEVIIGSLLAALEDGAHIKITFDKDLNGLYASLKKDDKLLAESDCEVRVDHTISALGQDLIDRALDAHS